VTVGQTAKVCCDGKTETGAKAADMAEEDDDAAHSPPPPLLSIYKYYILKHVEAYILLSSFTM